MKYPNNFKGLTLIELLIMMVLLSITLSMAVPFTNAFVHKQMKEASRQNVLSAFRFARTTAINSRQLTTVCSLKPSGHCRLKWAKTLSVFQDTNGNGVLDPDERLLRTIEVNLSQWSQKNRPGNRSHFQWNSLGLSNGTPGSVELCHQSSTRNRFAVVVSFSGRIRTSLDFDGDGTEERTPNIPIIC